MPTGPAPPSDDLRLVVLALQLVSRGAPDIPVSLRSYLTNVLQEASGLAARPESLNPTSTPAAISLAFELARDADLRDLGEAGQVTPEFAKRLLSEMDHADARP